MIRWFAATVALAFAAPALAQSTGELAAQDLRLAVIADRMMAANAALCTQTMPITGLTMHSADQYGDETARALFPSGPVAAALVLPGSPAERAGLRAGDTLVAIAGQDLAALPPPEDGHLREAAFALLASQPPGETLHIGVRRGADIITATLTAPPGCRVLVEVVTGEGVMGRSDGRVIQISLTLAAMLDDDGLAVIFAHELAHVVLHHRVRLEEAGVRKGLLGEIGRNRRLNRRVEEEADLMSAHLLANAGYDPAIAPAFWHSPTGERAGGGLLRSRVYPSPEARGDRIAAEIAAHLPTETRPSWPAHLIALRDAPFAR